MLDDGNFRGVWPRYETRARRTRPLMITCDRSCSSRDKRNSMRLDRGSTLAPLDRAWLMSSTHRLRRLSRDLACDTVPIAVTAIGGCTSAVSSSGVVAIAADRGF